MLLLKYTNYKRGSVMRDYVTTVFNLIVGLVNADKIVYLALIGLGVILVWQLIGLLTNFHRRFAGKCRKISKFLIRNGLSTENYNNFLALIAKMPQEFIRGYKTFEHASYGLPSDYIKRFDSIDVETNGGILNHGKSLIKAAIYGWTIVLALLSLALLGGDAALTGFALADALIVPVLFLILAKVIYFIFNAIKQQQYKMAVDEFNEMLDIMNDKIENNDSLPGPDVLADLIDSVPVVENVQTEEQIMEQQSVNDIVEPATVEKVVITEDMLNQVEPVGVVEDFASKQNEESLMPPETVQEEISQEALPQTIEIKEDVDNNSEHSEEVSESNNEEWPAWQQVQEEREEQTESDVYTEEELVDEVVNVDENVEVTFEPEELAESVLQEEPEVEDAMPRENPSIVEERVDLVEVEETYKEENKETQKTQEIKEEEMEEKRGRGRPRKIEDGDLVIKNDKQFEEVLQRAEKLMRKSEEALSASQAKRVEKSLKDLIDAMTKYKEEH